MKEKNQGKEWRFENLKIQQIINSTIQPFNDSTIQQNTKTPIPGKRLSIHLCYGSRWPERAFWSG